MSLPSDLRDTLRLPAVCAPMFLVSGPELVAEACKAGLIGVLPRHNVRTLIEFDGWLAQVGEALGAHVDAGGPEPGPVAVNLDPRLEPDDLAAHLDVCERRGVRLVISAVGDPTRLAERVHERGWRHFHDVTTIRHAERAIAAGVDGLICIGSGGGGHSGTINHLALIPRVRAMFDGAIVMAGAISSGAAIRAAEVLGADLAYLGTRFAATRESLASADYKTMLVRETLGSLRFTGAVTGGAPANWLAPSLLQHGVDLDDLITTGATLPRGDARPWRDVWSAGQGIDQIVDIPTVAELVERLTLEYEAACALQAPFARRIGVASSEDGSS